MFSGRAYNEALLLRGISGPRINRDLGDVDMYAVPPVYKGPALIKPATQLKLMKIIGKVRCLTYTPHTRAPAAYTPPCTRAPAAYTPPCTRAPAAMHPFRNS